MTAAGHGAAEARRRRLKVALSLLRSALIITVLTLAYYLLPFDRAIEVATALWITLGLLVIAFMIAWQVRMVTRSEQPRLRAVESVATVVPLLILLFSSADFVLARNDAGSFSQPLNRTDALYFTVSVFSSVGFGDIVPRDQAARVLTTIQMLVDLIVIGAVLRVLLGAVRVALRRRPGDGAPPPGDDES
jgi:hypothetical protein